MTLKQTASHCKLQVLQAQREMKSTPPPSPLHVQYRYHLTPLRVSKQSNISQNTYTDFILKIRQ